MAQFLYSLETYSGKKSRHTCPLCQERGSFSRYVNTQTGEYIADYVGRCNREHKCRYHYTPRQYFGENEDLLSLSANQSIKKRRTTYKLSNNYSSGNDKVKPNTIDENFFIQSLKAYDKNNFILYLNGRYGEAIVNNLISRYHIGSSKFWPCATVFWQIDSNKKIRSGKIMLYDSKTGKRVKNPYPHINWVHKVLRLEDFKLRQCLFGEHLLAQEPLKPIGLVESEKTAIIASIHLPELLWLAVGSLSNLSKKRCQMLNNRRVFLFPDLGAHEKWKKRAHDLGFKVSDLLEKHASEVDKREGLDIADYLTAKTDINA